MSSFAKPIESPFAAEGGLRSQPPVAGDPYEALDELMAVVEALCPVWPQRPAFTPDCRMLL